MPQALPDYDDLKRQQETEQRLIAGQQVGVDVNRASRILNLQGQTGLPQEVIDNDLEYIEEQARQQSFDPKKYRETNKKFAQFAAENPYHLAVLQDDEDEMTRTEWVMDALFDWSAVGMAKRSSFAQREMGFIGDRQRRGDFREGDDARLKELSKYVTDHDFDTSGFKSLVVASTKQAANFLGSWEYGLRRAAVTAPAGAVVGGAMGTGVGGIGALPGAVAGYGAGFTAGMVGGGFEYSSKVEGGHAYLEYRELGFSHEDAAWAATIAGNINGLFEAVGGQIIFEKLPGVRSITGRVGDEVVKQLMGRTTFREVARRAAADWGVGVAGEVVTEIAQEATTITMGEVLKAKDGQEGLTREEWIDRIADITTETIKSTALIAGVGPGQRLIQDGKRARDAKAMEQAWIALGEAAKDSKVRQNVKGKYREFVESLTKDGALRQILISPDRFDEYFQGKGMDPDEVAKELNIENIDEARELGHKVKIPIGDYAEKIAPTEHHDGLRPDITTEEGQMSARQAEEFEANREELEQEIESLAAPMDAKKAQAQEKIIADVEGQLIAAGTERSAAAHQAKIMVGMVNLAERMGMEPSAIYDRMFAGVRQALPESMQFADVDVTIDPLLDMLRSGDFPTQREMQGQSLTEFIRERGGLTDEGGELAARDFGELINKGTGKSKGDTMDGMAEVAHEAGFIAERDPEVLMAAIEREMGGTPVFGHDSPGDPGKRILGEKLDDLGKFLESEDMDIQVLSNAEIRALLEGDDTFEQIDTKELVELQETLAALSRTEETVAGELRGEDPVSTMLAAAETRMPSVFNEQDFSQVEFTDTVRIEETGEIAEVTENAQKVFDRAVKRRNTLRKLWKCVSG